MTLVYLWTCDRCETQQDGDSNEPPNGWLQAAEGDFCSARCEREDAELPGKPLLPDRSVGQGLQR